MCLIVLAYRSHPGYRLILAANRDEFYNRATLPAHWWEDSHHLLAGKDLKAGGTWLGITKTGRMAAVTNFRSKTAHKPDAPSRGRLVSDYLTADLSPRHYLEGLRSKSASYNDFNLVIGDTDGLFHYCSRDERFSELAPGIHGLSNAFLDTPWPKVVRAKKVVEDILAKEPVSIESIFALLKESDSAPDHELPDTGIGLAYERVLSPIFIQADGYGTRSSTVLTVNNENNVTFIERSFVPPAENSHTFKITKFN